MPRTAFALVSSCGDFASAGSSAECAGRNSVWRPWRRRRSHTSPPPGRRRPSPPQHTPASRRGPVRRTTRTRSRRTRSAIVARNGASSAAAAMRAAVTAPTAATPPSRNATTPSATMNALSPAHIAANEICARRSGPLCATWPSAPAQSRNLGATRAPTTRLSQGAPPRHESRPPRGPPFNPPPGRSGSGPGRRGFRVPSLTPPSRVSMRYRMGPPTRPGSFRRWAHDVARVPHYADSHGPVADQDEISRSRARAQARPERVQFCSASRAIAPLASNRSTPGCRHQAVGVTGLSRPEHCRFRPGCESVRTVAPDARPGQLGRREPAIVERCCFEAEAHGEAARPGARTRAPGLLAGAG